MSDLSDKFETWAILEIMGHRRLGGFVTEEERFGCKMARIDIPAADGAITTQYYGGGSIYAMTPCTEEIARAFASRNQPEPVHRWELPQLPSPDDDLPI